MDSHKRSGKNFRKAIGNFVIGLDKMCLMGDHHGRLNMIGSDDKKKHEKLLQDNRASTMLSRASIANGTTRTTVFLLKATKRRTNFDGEFLVPNGLGEVLSIVITNVLKNSEAQIKSSYSIIRDYCSLHHTTKRSSSLVLDLLDGFKHKIHAI